MGNKLDVFSEEAFKQGKNFALSLFNIIEFHVEQEKALREFLLGRIFFFSAPTGYGKSLILQSKPMLFADAVSGLPPGTSTLIVISPLKSLMMDQVAYLKSVGAIIDLCLSRMLVIFVKMEKIAGLKRF